MNFIENNDYSNQQKFSSDAINQISTENQNAQNTMPTEDMQPKMQNSSLANIDNEIQFLRTLMQNGFISPQQGLNWFCERINNLNKVQDNVTTKYDFANNEFLKKTEYKCVLDYLKNTNADFDEDEISQITELVQNLENNAIKRYLTNQDYKQKQNAENTLAKQKLTNSARKGSADFSGPVFTREMIGKMNSTEFVKNEKAIMEQLKKGLIH